MPGKSVIVTGGSSGIGKAAAELLVNAGHAVTIADVAEAAGQAVAAHLEAQGKGRAQFVLTDVRDPTNVRSMVEKAVAAYGRLDGAVNCAGVPQASKLTHELSLEDWDFCNNINLRGMFLCLKYEIAAMLEGKSGSIVAISSAAATLGLPKSADYCASKAGITGLVRAAAVDYARSGIRINALLPGATLTPLATRSSAANPGISDALPVPIGRWASPQEIAEGAVWLISDASSYVTGACIAIDGGMAIG